MVLPKDDIHISNSQRTRTELDAVAFSAKVSITQETLGTPLH